MAEFAALPSHQCDRVAEKECVAGLHRWAASAALFVMLLASGSSGLADAASPVTMTNVGSPSPVLSGAELTYTISMVNGGGAKISDVVLNDQFNGLGGIGVPPQLQLATTRGTCSQTINGVTCQAGDQMRAPGRRFVAVLAPGLRDAQQHGHRDRTKAAQNFTTTTTTSVWLGGGCAGPDDDEDGPTSVVEHAGRPVAMISPRSATRWRQRTDVVTDTVPADLTIRHGHQPSSAPSWTVCSGGAVTRAPTPDTINAVAPMVETTLTNTAVVDPENAIAKAMSWQHVGARPASSLFRHQRRSRQHHRRSAVTGAGPIRWCLRQRDVQILATNNASTRRRRPDRSARRASSRRACWCPIPRSSPTAPSVRAAAARCRRAKRHAASARSTRAARSS
jgi:hypothetical protein